MTYSEQRNIKNYTNWFVDYNNKWQYIVYKRSNDMLFVQTKGDGSGKQYGIIPTLSEGGKWRPATEEEISYLDKCITYDKKVGEFISKKDTYEIH